MVVWVLAAPWRWCRFLQLGRVGRLLVRARRRPGLAMLPGFLDLLLRGCVFRYSRGDFPRERKTS